MRLLTTEFTTIEFDPVRGIVRYTRSGEPYRSVEEIHEEADRIAGALAPMESGQRMLVDVRSVAPRNDPDFETAIVELRHKLFKGTSRVAVLVRTAVGALQLQRHMREDGVAANIFDSETQALAYLMERPVVDLPPSTHPRRSIRSTS
jgi:hypothetical protein